MLTDNRAVFANTEFQSWVERRNLIPAEKFLIEKYYCKTGKTLEAGTGAGRILYAMKSLGFTALHGFDLVFPLVDCAKKKDCSNSIGFEVQDATRLAYKDSTFDQIMYLQQVLCFIDAPASRARALNEAYRVLKSGGTALFSFLSFEARTASPLYLSYLVYIGMLRMLKPSKRAIQYLPWLRLGGKFNWRSLVDAAPYVYWYRLKEIVTLLQDTGFQIVAIGSTQQIQQGVMHGHYETLSSEEIKGMLYIVCKK